MWSVSLLALLHLCGPASAQNYWSVQRDDLAEYQLAGVAANVRSDAECVTLAQPQHQAIAFSQTDGACRMYSCQLGLTGCRKCRNAKNSSLPLLLVRRLNQLGHTCWRTFQHRVDGSVDFYRNWTDYLAPFGQGEDRNYWMGLEAIHELTQGGDRRVRWEMSMWNSSWFWWEDAFITVLGADQGYRLTLGLQDLGASNIAHCPLATPSFMHNQNFSTPDRDQDTNSENCAIIYQGAWWYSSCHCFNPNGRYFTPPTAFNLAGNIWANGLTFGTTAGVYPFNHYYSMQTFECLASDSV